MLDQDIRLDLISKVSSSFRDDYLANERDKSRRERQEEMLGIPNKLEFYIHGKIVEERYGYKDTHCESLRCRIFTSGLHRALPKQRFVCLGIPCGFRRRN